MEFNNHTSCHCINKLIENANKITAHRIENPDRICPPKFIRVKNNHNEDACDCIDGHTNCIRLKSGHEHFPMDSRR